MTIQIRKAEISDCPAILEISSQIWDGGDYVPNVLDKWLNGNEGILWCALWEGKIGGFARSTYLSGNRCWLEGIRVGIDARGKGLGKALASFQLKDAFEKGFESCGLSSFVENYESLHIVRTHGFEEVARFKVYDGSAIFGTDETEVFKKNCEAQRQEILKDCQIRPIKPEETQAIMEAMTDSEMLQNRNQYLSYDWTFEKFNPQWIAERISAGDFYKIECLEDSGFFSLSNKHVKGKILTVNYVSSEAIEKQALAYGIERAIESGCESFGYMALDNRSDKAFKALGLDTYIENPQDVFVFEKKGWE